MSSPGAAESEEKWGVKAHGKRAEREPITGVWGRAPSGVQGQSPWSGGLVGEAPQKLKAFLFQDVTQSNQGKRFSRIAKPSQNVSLALFQNAMLNKRQSRFLN